MPDHIADAELEAYLKEVSECAWQTPDVPEMRRGTAERARARPRGPEMARVRELEIAGIPARLYRPADKPGPLLLYLHGGGWTIGSLESHDRACRRLAAGANTSVLALDYRLAPEHPWPASVDDTVAAVRHIARNRTELEVDGGTAVGGDSAGGALAALACLRLRDEQPGALPDVQLLLYPNTDLTGGHPSMQEKAVGYGLAADDVRFFNSQWVPDRSLWSDPGVSALHAADLHGLPEAIIVTAEHDPLRDEGEAYARRLGDANVAVNFRNEAGLVHNFMLLDTVSPACAAAVDRVAADLEHALKARRSAG